ncbi:hypothetical protein [Methylobacterium oxalidis]|uniref:Bacteriophage late control gene D protein n=1 Tax=Methylobacterium oxalidis TaxID=944322 RepID=A0A512IX34_9HYPH|nr:hypothetical protein [Methylobacterium oxalidis]GEP02277.1 bacteriophage late control gene D protein [Methylobacterium oxalidis]GJE32267.1 hypothetical protein LDDCCGHA_2453 [Methylobacterium oxalidis]GLS62222.1 bacteriophage late control gene D protein [Methylobacterium oxalidis]
MVNTYTPVYRIDRNGEDITGNFNDRCISLEVRLAAGYGEGDTLTITLDDRDWKISKPTNGETLSIYLGYKETGFSYIGTFEINSISYAWAPKTISIHGTSVSFMNAAKAPAVKAYDSKTLGEIVRDIAKSAGVEAAVSPELDSVKIPFRNSFVSPLHLLQELERTFGAVAKFGEGKLSFTPRDTGDTASGQETPLVVLNPSDIASLELRETSRGSHSKVKAAFFDKTENIKKYVESASPFSSDENSPIYTLGPVFNSQVEAQAAATSKMSDLLRGYVDGGIVLSRGDPFIRDQSRVYIQGARDGINGSYIADMVRHSFTTANGLNTSMHIHSNGTGNDYGSIANADTATPSTPLPGMPTTTPRTGSSTTTPDTGLNGITPGNNRGGAFS